MTQKTQKRIMAGLAILLILGLLLGIVVPFAASIDY